VGWRPVIRDRQAVGPLYPTFAGLRLSCGQDRALDRLEQQQFALAASKARSKLPLKGTKALPCDDLDTRHRLLL
jgi:hypothetical protein